MNQICKNVPVLKNETDDHKIWKETFLTAVGNDSDRFKEVMQKHGCSYKQVRDACISFGWREQLEVEREQDPWRSEHREEIKGLRDNAFHLLLKNFNNEMLAARVPGAEIPKSIQDKQDAGLDVEAAHDLIEFIKNLPVKPGNYKALKDLVELAQLIIFDWEKNKINSLTLSQTTINQRNQFITRKINRVLGQ